MSRPGGRRSEDDLRAAFAAKATQAPKAEDVLRAVRRATRPRPSRLRWLLPAAVAAAVVAIAVPLALSANDSNSGSSKRPGRAAAGGGVSARPQPKQAATNAPNATPSAPCRPDQVRAAVTVRSDAGVERATLTVTALADCSLARVPRVTWNGTTVTAARPAALSPGGGDTSAAAAPSSEAAGSAYGRLAAGATATATIQAGDPCSTRSGDAVHVDWGAGEVKLRATGAATACGARAHPAKLSIEPFTGLS